MVILLTIIFLILFIMANKKYWNDDLVGFYGVAF